MSPDGPQVPEEAGPGCVPEAGTWCKDDVQAPLPVTLQS